MRMSKIKCSLRIDKVELQRRITRMKQCFYLKTLLFLNSSSKTLTLSIIHTQIRSTQSFQNNTLKPHRQFLRNLSQLYRFLCKTMLKTSFRDKHGHSQFRTITSYLKLILKISQESIHSGNDLQKYTDKICLLHRTKQLQLLIILVEFLLWDHLLNQRQISIPSLIQMLKRLLSISKHLLSNINKKDKLPCKYHNSHRNRRIYSSQLLNSNSNNLDQLNKLTRNLQVPLQDLLKNNSKKCTRLHLTFKIQFK